MERKPDDDLRSMGQTIEILNIGSHSVQEAEPVPRIPGPDMLALLVDDTLSRI